jgi:hypothetical protein
MKKYITTFSLLLLLLPIQINAQNLNLLNQEVEYPGVPHISAYEAYLKYKEGRAIIVQAGGEHYGKRHILGALNMGPEAGVKSRIESWNFPKSGIKILTYCY